MNKKNIENSLNKITITPGGIGIYDGQLSIKVIRQGKIIRGVSLNPKDINSLPDQTAAIVQEFVRDYFVKNVSLNKSSYKDMEMEPQLKKELGYKYKLKLWKLEIIWR